MSKTITVKWLKKQLAKASEGARLREASRSEFTRVLRVIRSFALKTGQLAGVEEDIFFLYIAEVLGLLSGKDFAVKYISARKENYEKYKALPPFPPIIRGRFNPVEWAKNPNRRSDYFAPMISIEVSDSETLRGYPGVAGRVEGSVRILLNPEEGKNVGYFH